MIKNILIGATLIGASLQAVAATSLPYAGARTDKSCIVNLPTNSNDNGYVMSEDCNVLYVKPPKGMMEETGSFSLGITALCPTINKTWHAIADLQERQIELEKQSNNSSSLDTDLIDQLLIIATKINRYKRALDKLAGDDISKVLQLTVELPWRDVMDSYKAINPSLEVARLPIAMGIMTTAQTEIKGAPKGIIDTEVIGLKPTEVSWLQNGKPLPTIAIDNSSNNYIFGTSMNMKLSMNLIGSCVKNDSNDAGAIFAPTYSYFYPMKTRMIQTVSVNKASVAGVINDFIHQSGGSPTFSINRDALRAALDNNSALHVTAQEALYALEEEPEETQKAMEIELKNIVIDRIFAEISTAFIDARSESIRIKRTKAHRRVCKKVLFFKKCKNRTYTVSTKYVDKDLLTQKMNEMDLKDYVAEDCKYYDFMSFDTVSFLNKKESSND